MEIILGRQVEQLNMEHLDILSMTEEEFNLSRKQGLGASDASVYLNLMGKWKCADDLIAEKCRMYYSEEDREIAQKDVVRKGKDLEPLILAKAEKQFGHQIIKPVSMYRHTEYDYLTISFDGVMLEDDFLVPVEAKFVSTYGDKYYNRNTTDADLVNWDISYDTEKKAALVGIPPYYYAQVQQQMLGLNSPYGYLAVQFDKDWFFRTYKVPRDEAVIKDIIVEGFRTWQKIIARRKLGTGT